MLSRGSGNDSLYGAREEDLMFGREGGSVPVMAPAFPGGGGDSFTSVGKAVVPTPSMGGAPGASSF